MKPTGLLDRTHAILLDLARIVMDLSESREVRKAQARLVGIIAGLEGEALAKGSTDGDILPAIARPRCECKLSPHGADGCRRTAFDKFTRNGAVVWLCDLCDLTADVRVVDEPAIAKSVMPLAGGNTQGPLPGCRGCRACICYDEPDTVSPTTALAPVEPSAPSEAKPTVPPSAETAPGPLGAGGGPLYIAISGNKPPEVSISQGVSERSPRDVTVDTLIARWADIIQDGVVLADDPGPDQTREARRKGVTSVAEDLRALLDEYDHAFTFPTEHDAFLRGKIAERDYPSFKVSEHRIGQRVSVRVAIPNVAEGTRIGTVTGMDMYAVDIGLGFPIAVRAEDVEGCE